ncbi:MULTISPECIES: hypothetical protein [Sphingobium]|uniref:Uncharacterized protein n=1 Tax=Sphingobium baderi TaxID=1332080 RepID=A0A0S3EUW2_9SPHN|nr:MULTISPECIES: hypothetical protein [Sphingobium]ALR19208.1 hypothetical protein ATN00_01685 [Sphingobium baderi]
MARTFWIAGASATGAAVLLGMGLGHFVTTPERAPRVAETEMFDAPEDDLAGFAPTTPEQGPAVIRCTGCGPTLAERQMAADQGNWDADGMIHGSTDPVVQDYMTSGDGTAMPVETPPASASRLSPSPERLAAGEDPSPAAIPKSVPVKVRPTLAPAVPAQP